MQVPKILVVEDEVQILEAIKAYIERRMECDISKACDGKDALEKIEKESFDLVILDLHMPKLGGIEIMKAAKLKKELPDIIVVTAYDSNEIMQTALKIGAIDYMPKPLELETLMLKTKAILERKGKYILKKE